MLNWSIHGILGLSFSEIAIYLVVVTHITIVSVTVYLHRFSAHRSLLLNAPISHFFRFWLWLTTGQVTREWTAVHRKHHAECETTEDPHSPVRQGLTTILWEGVETYKSAIADQETLRRYGRGCPDDWLEMNLYRHNSLGIGLLLVINLVLFGLLGITVWAIQMIWIPFFAAGIINGVGHSVGYRNFESPDASRNIFPLGLLIGGEELHNNHHTYPNSAKLSRKAYEFDIGWFWIKLFCFIGMASVVSQGPVVQRNQKKKSLDSENVWALLNDRFNVMATYSEEVISPIVKAEYIKADKRGRRLLKKARKLLAVDEILLDRGKRLKISQLLETNAKIKIIYDLRLELEEIWKQRGSDVTEVLTSLKAWVEKAESKQERTLDEFVQTLSTYYMPEPNKS